MNWLLRKVRPPRVVPRRFPTRLVLVIVIVAITYIPQLGVPDNIRMEARGIAELVALAWLRTWAIQMGRRLPDRKRYDDPEE